MPESTFEFTPCEHIPEFLIGEVQSKLAYVDEAILQALVSPGGDSITLRLRQPLDPSRQGELEEKAQRVVLSMVKGAYKPKVQVLEDHLDRPVPYNQDPHVELAARQEVSQEMQGIFALGPLVARLIADF